MRRYDAIASPFGCVDLAGNVMEWTSTPVDAEGELAPDYVIKGGCWSASIDEARAWKRHTDPPHDLWNALGFRCAATPGPTSSSTTEPTLEGVQPAPTQAAWVLQMCELLEDELELPIPGAFNRRDKLEEATARCIEVAESLGDASIALRARCIEARRLAAYGAADEAVRAGESCVEQARQLDDRRCLGVGLLATGKALCRRNLALGQQLLDAEPAEQSLVEAIDVLQSASMTLSALEALIWLSSAQRLLSKPEAARDTARIALTVVC